MIQPEWISGNIFIRENRLSEIGDEVHGKPHNFDHTTIIFTGAVHVKKYKRLVKEDGSPALDAEGNELWQMEKEKDFHAPSHFLVEANNMHEIVAIEKDTIFWCVYSHREPQGRITQEYTGWEKAYN